MRWYELMIEGDGEALEALLAASPGDEIYGRDLRLAESSFTDRVLEFLHAQSHHILFVSAPRAGALVRSLREDDSDLNLEWIREVVGGRFRFKAEAYNRDVAKAIRDALTVNLPAGISCLDFLKEENDPEARGIELFTPVHDYVFKASGTIEGVPPGILEMSRRLTRLDFVQEEPLELETREVSEDGLTFLAS